MAHDPIEKKPLFHFFPGSVSLSLATFGCNFRCAFCQNHSISQIRRKSAEILTPPDQIVQLAVSCGCRSISYTYTEPTIFYEYAHDIGLLARSSGVKNVFVTNGFMSPEAIEHASVFLDAANVDLKCFSDQTYRHICGAALEPVLRSIQLLSQAGVWIEITTLLVPGMNDTEKEIEQIASFIASVSVDIPWHISRFHPDFQMMDRDRTPEATLLRAREIGKRSGLRYVYLGNIRGHAIENTLCPGCGKLIIERDGFMIIQNTLLGAACPNCSRTIAGIFT